MQLFGTNGQKFYHCPRTKGQRDKLKSCKGTGRARTAKIRDGTQDKTGQSRKGRSKAEKQRSKTRKDVLEQENDVLKQKKMFYNRKISSKT